MCGIIGAIASQDVQSFLLDGLARMEYRGYDSAGICVLDQGAFTCCKTPGKLAKLDQALADSAMSGHIGIAHTRWATHGAPNQINAHPHLSDRAAVVHNGIIENNEVLRERLQADGADFKSETDSETIPWLFSRHLKQHSNDVLAAWRACVAELEGAYAIVCVLNQDAQRLWVARYGSPLLLGRGKQGVFAASDALALAGLADEVIYLHEGDTGSVSLDDCQVFDAKGRLVRRDWQPMPLTTTKADKGGFSHFMEKEIFEQPRVISDILQAYVHHGEIRFPEARFVHESGLPERIVMVACGTSYHAALTARYWLERYLQISVEVDVASEYRYRDPVIGPNTWLVTLSQSGETADTLEALRLFKQRTPDNLALTLCNVPHASLARESDGVIQLHAGPEIGVASTKAYTAQLTVLVLFSLLLTKRSGTMNTAQVDQHLETMRQTVPGISRLLDQVSTVAALASLFTSARGALFLGRGPCYPVALEGALKLKEISYLHAEGYAAGEMKHGPIALVDEHLPVVVLALQQYHLQKVLSNLRETQARGAKVVLLTDLDQSRWPDDVEAIVSVPEGDYFSTPLLATVPLQLLAYHVARSMGTDVDQPRNLAKSVTVE